MPIPPKNPAPSGVTNFSEIRTFYPGLMKLAEGYAQHPIDPETAEWVDGPSFCHWWRNNVGEDLSKDDGVQRRWFDWDRGAAIQLQRVDSLLTSRGFHIHDLPANCWRDSPRPKAGFQNKGTTAEIRAGAVQALRDGDPVHEVAERFDVTPRTVRVWRQKSR